MGQSEGCPKRQHVSQLYGNGCGSEGRALPNRCCNQCCSAQKLKIQEPCLLANPLNPNSTRRFAVTLRAGLGPPGVASLSFCWPAALQEPACGARASSSCDFKAHLFAQQSAPKGSSCHSRTSLLRRGPSEQAVFVCRSKDGALRSRMVMASV